MKKKLIQSLPLITITLLFLNIQNIIPSINCEVPEEKVQNLFGDLYQGDIYSGYLSTSDKNKNLHYLLASSQSDNASKDPLVLWLNGGPGCSSLLGFIQEHGPVVIPDYTTKFQLNQYAWNKNANVLYLESPAGVGFSYNDNGKEDMKYNDDIVANDARNALLNFFEKFPELKANDFYIAGESYAGVYVPKLAENILQNSKNLINLKGIFVGNGLTDLEVDISNALVDFAYGHGLYSMETHFDYKKYCNTTDFSDPCIQTRKEVRSSLQGLNIYDVYRSCPKAKDFKGFYPNREKKLKKMEKISQQRMFLNVLKKIDKKQREKKLGNSLFKKFENLSADSIEKNLGLNSEIEKYVEKLNEEDEGIWPDGCLDDPYPTDFFNLEETKEKLHVRKSIQYVQCNDYININYEFSDSLNIYRNTLLNSGIRIWFYSGDTDGAVPFTGSIKWLPKLNMDITEPYRKWVVNEQTAGYVQSYDSMVFVTVLGTGHMAPQWKREQGFVLFNKFLKGERLPLE